MKKAAKKRSKKPPSGQQQILVFKDAAGNYYELTRAAFERGRVSDRRKKKIAAALKDVPGKFWYIFASTVPGSIKAPKFVGASELHYAGFFVSSTKAKR
jgi:hypothetical protein